MKFENVKYKLLDIWHDIEVFFHDIFFPWNKLHIKTLPRKWTDRDTVLLHANFQILSDYVEGELFSKNNPHPILLDVDSETKWMHEYEFSEEVIKNSIENINKSNEDVLKLMKLYKWWKHERPIRETNYPGRDFDTKDSNTPECRKWGEEFDKYEKMCDDEDTNNLIELIKLRKYLWS